MERTLTSLALVTAMWDQYQKDYLDIFVPFIATLIDKKNVTSFKEDNLDTLCQMFFEEFGLRIPAHPMIAILNRCKKQKLLYKEHGEFKPRYNIIVKYDFSQNEATLIRKQNTIIRDYINFAKNHYNIKINETYAIEILLNFLKKSDIDILFASKSKSILPDIHLSRKYKQYSFILNKYLTFIYENQIEYFEYLCDSAMGHIISSVVLLDDIQLQNETVTKCNIYIDTPLILQLLGASNKYKENAIKFLLKALKENRAELKIFRHNYQEVLYLLENAINWVDSPDYDPIIASKTVRYFKNEGYTKSYVERLLNKIDDLLNEFDITVEDLPEYITKEKFLISSW